MYEVLNWAAPNWINLNRTMWGQTWPASPNRHVHTKQDRAKLNLTDTVFFFWTPSNFLKKHKVWKQALFLSSGKEAPNLVDPRDWAILSQWPSQKQ